MNAKYKKNTGKKWKKIPGTEGHYRLNGHVLETLALVRNDFDRKRFIQAMDLLLQNELEKRQRSVRNESAPLQPEGIPPSDHAGQSESESESDCIPGMKSVMQKDRSVLPVPMAAGDSLKRPMVNQSGQLSQVSPVYHPRTGLNSIPVLRGRN